MDAIRQLDAALARICRDIDRRCSRFLHREARSAGQRRRRERERVEAEAATLFAALPAAGAEAENLNAESA